MRAPEISPMERRGRIILAGAVERAAPAHVVDWLRRSLPPPDQERALVSLGMISGQTDHQPKLLAESLRGVAQDLQLRFFSSSVSTPLPPDSSPSGNGSP